VCCQAISASRISQLSDGIVRIERGAARTVIGARERLHPGPQQGAGGHWCARVLEKAGKFGVDLLRGRA
jgi:hypothetical protein